MVKHNEPLYFADVCAGPGGFSEYVLWRKQWRSKGFGFTLKNTGHDFKLEDFFAGSPETFEPHYGVGGVDGDGDVFKTENILKLQRPSEKLVWGPKTSNPYINEGGAQI